ncbi:endophilin-b1 isoform x4 [Limosa lapponica baueri]|uniref:Endophilin-B1 n=1 Tax=Limosa lapponica baueri TaxID=1758121 RepID=A0A2I0UQK5_LIMLA|nr:endophilin-b1 isoform x4 [Limosa lapponica baueri]
MQSSVCLRPPRPGEAASPLPRRQEVRAVFSDFAGINSVKKIPALKLLNVAKGSMVWLNENGYEDLVVAIDPQVPEDPNIILNTMNMIKSASNHLFEMTKHRFFFKSVKIIIPKTWKKNTKYSRLKTESYDKADVIIGDHYMKHVDDPYTLQYGGCKEKGQYIHFTPNFLLNDSLTKVYGEKGRVFVHEWAHLRWGVFDEYNNDVPFYVSRNSKKASVEATSCPAGVTGSPIFSECNGDKCEPRDCRYNGQLYEKGCVFIPYIQQNVSCSVMWMQSIRPHDRIGHLYSAAEDFLLRVIEITSWVAIVTFDSDASEKAPLQQITNDGARKKLVQYLPTVARGKTNICAGIRKGLKLIADKMTTTYGSEILLLTDGEDTRMAACLDLVKQSGAKIHTIALGPEAAKELEEFSKLTGGLMLSAVDGATPSKLSRIFGAITSGSGDISEQSIQVGDWQFCIKNVHTATQGISVTATSRPASSDVPPVRTAAHVSRANSAFNPVVVYAEVSQGFLPVLGAAVIATIEKDGAAAVTLELLDNGVGKIYMNAPRPEFTDKEIQAKLGSFSRISVSSLVVKTKEDSAPVYPPCKITDLHARIENKTIVLTWTAPGGDLDNGKADHYIIKSSENLLDLRNHFDRATPVDCPNLIPKEAGREESFKIEPEHSVIQNGTIIYFAICAVDDMDLISEVSNIARATWFIPPKASVPLIYDGNKDIANSTVTAVPLNYDGNSDSANSTVTVVPLNYDGNNYSASSTVIAVPLNYGSNNDTTNSTVIVVPLDYDGNNDSANSTMNIMDFNVKKLAADAGTFLSRAVQFTEEKLGQAEKTELDAHLENLLSKAECTKLWTEKIMKQTEVLLQPNPNARIEEFVYEKLDRKAPSRMNNPELLGQYMIDAGNEFGPGTAYGNALIKCGETQKRIGTADRELIQTSAINFLTPLRNFIEGDYKTITKERKLLQNKRLDLDAAKTRLKKAKVAEARAASEQEVRITQSEFDRQAEITRLLLEGISSTHAHHLRCLNDFVEAQMTYYAQCYQYMLDLQKQLGSFPSTFLSNNNQTSSTPVQSVSTPSVLASASASLPSVSNSIVTSGISELKSSSGSRKARVLYDYDAANSSELSLLADEVITVYSIPGMDSDWLMGERGNQKGKVPITYLELLN